MRPLVGPGPELTGDQAQRYARHLVLPGLGPDGQRRLRNARVLVVGAGGLGSPVLLYLAAAGIGTIGIVDGDDVDVSNLQRQIVHGVDDVGRAKVDSAAEAVAALDPSVTVHRHHLRLGPEAALDLFRDYDLVVDGADNFPTRYLVSDACELLNLPCVWGSIYRFDGQVAVFWRAPADGTPGVTYRDVHPTPPAPGAVPSCEEAGVVGAVCAAIGSVMALEVVKLVTGLGRPLLGRLQVFEGLDSTWRTLQVRAIPGRPPVTALRDDAGVTETEPEPQNQPDEPDRPDQPQGDELSPAELAGLLADDAADIALIDVREPWETEICAIPGAVVVPMSQWRTAGDAEGFKAMLAEATGGRRTVLYCKVGGRSGQLLQVLQQVGASDVQHLRGGVLAWIDDVDPGQRRY